MTTISITRLLVANRGEIARRIFRTCRALGIETAAVFTDPDAGAHHVAEADHAVRLGGDPKAYLDVGVVVAAALACGADAVHPGYGFLSENAAFARAVIEAGLTWIGPSPEAIAAMGGKIEAKALMAAAGVPVLPHVTITGAGPEGEIPEPPLLVKASAGGGGRGMRIVRDLAELPGALEAARREAAAAFGDGTLFAEPLLEGARHIEVQIMADRHGTVWALGERECSIQRRHQKVIEEAPSPAVTPELRERLCAAATEAARAIGYTGAGTVEFMLTEGRFHFLEMNTRLQVEHPVTELIYDLDLVRLQIEVAEGAALPAGPPRPSGHAIEARLYAEDPARGWLPQTGALHRFSIPGQVRVDAGVGDAGTINPHYDPMIAKVIAYAPTREAAARKLAAALAGARLHGPVTNRDLLVNVLRHPAFLSGATDTSFLDAHGDLAAPLAGPEDLRLSALAAALAGAAANRAGAKVLASLPGGWRNVASQPQRTRFEEVEIAYRITREGLLAEGFPDVALISAEPGEVVLERAGIRRAFAVAAHPEGVFVDSVLGPVRLTPVERLPAPVTEVAPGSLIAPMPGVVIRVEVTEGDTVKAGQTVVVLEAMKMEHQITSPLEGVVAGLGVTRDQHVEAGAVLAVITGVEERTQP